MNRLSSQFEIKTFQVLNKDITVQDFEKWIYANSDQLQAGLESDLYFDLISFNYNQKDSLKLLQDKLKPHIDKYRFDIWRIKSVLTAIIENRIDLVLATRKLSTLYFETGENLIPVTLGIGCESEIGDFPTPNQYHLWNKDTLTKLIDTKEAYRNSITKDAKKFLKVINQKEKTADNNDYK